MDTLHMVHFCETNGIGHLLFLLYYLAKDLAQILTPL